VEGVICRLQVAGYRLQVAGQIMMMMMMMMVVVVVVVVVNIGIL